MRFTSSAVAIALALFWVTGHAAIGQDKESKLSDLEKSAKQFVEFLEKGEFEKATKDYDEAMQKALPADKLGETWKALIARSARSRNRPPIRLRKSRSSTQSW